LPKEAETGSLKDRLTDDLKQSLRGGDKVRVSVIRLLMAAIHNAEIARGGALSNGDVLGIITKEVRQHNESIEAFKQGNRADLIAKEEAEMVILQEYLPQQLTRDEIAAEARKVIAEVGAQGPGDKGKVMSQIMARLKGKADGREINAVVTELLAS
jgi:uncharacterized protein YqeY